MNARPMAATIRILAAGWVLAGLVASAQAADAPKTPIALGEEAWRRGDLTEAIRHFRVAADAGNAPAQARLADILDKAELDEEAVAWFRKAAAQGDPAGLYGLGQMHAAGEGVPKSPQLALRHWQDAAQRGHVLALLALARTYESGWADVAADPAKSLGYWQKAAEIGDGAAAQRLASAYRKGELGVAIDAARAAEWDRRAQPGAKR